MSRADTADVVVDVSNVCWSTELPPQPPPPGPRPDRLHAVVAAWRERYPGGGMRLFADRSLRHAFADGGERRAWSATVRALRIEEVAFADVPILEHAAAHGSYVISRDQYVDHRKDHPWIDTNPDRFLGWRVHAGRVTLVPSGIHPEPHHKVSRYAEVRDLKDARLDPMRHRDLLHTRWRCDDTGCLQARMWQEALLLWPAAGPGGRALCPSCRGPLTALGPRAVTRQIIVTSAGDGAELLRFPIEHGAPLVVGRGRLDNGVSLDVVCRADDRPGRLSRQHALLSLDARGGLHVVDLGSGNGTTLRRDGGQWMRLAADEGVPLHDRDALRLAGVVQLEISGRRFLADTRRPAGVSDDVTGTEISAVGEGL